MSLLSQIASPKPCCSAPALGNFLSFPTISLFLSPKGVHPRPRTPRLPSLLASAAPDSAPNAHHDNKKKIHRPREANHRGDSSGDAADEQFPTTIPRKPRRGRRSEAAAVEDFVRDSLERTFISIREQNREALKGKPPILKEKAPENSLASEADWVVTEEEDRDWPLDADVGWGVRASEYFENHPIKNVVVDGEEIDWEGDMEEGWVKEINCLEWERFAFHPSPLIVLVFERYNRAAENWRLLKELEKAAKVYWSAVDRLPPRTVKVDMNIERDLAYALQVRECPQLLFLRGNKIIFREKEHRTADQLVQMIAHFYYNAKKPSWIDKTAIAPSYPF